MKITWFGHSCFKIENDGYAIVVDPYTKGSIPGLAALDTEANKVTVHMSMGIITDEMK